MIRQHYTGQMKIPSIKSIKMVTSLYTGVTQRTSTNSKTFTQTTSTLWHQETTTTWTVGSETSTVRTRGVILSRHGGRSTNLNLLPISMTLQYLGQKSQYGVSWMATRTFKLNCGLEEQLWLTGYGAPTQPSIWLRSLRGRFTLLST